jgi:putative copper export protein
VIETALATFQQWLLFIGVSIGVGCVAWRIVVAPGAVRLLSIERAPALAEVERRMAGVGAVTGLVLLGAWILRMVAQVIGFRDPFVPLWEDASFLLFQTFWGTIWMAQGVIISILTVAFWRAMRRSAAPVTATDPPRSLRRLSPAWGVASCLVLLLVATLALSSHAMGVDFWAPLIVAADGLHALAAGAWIGTLALILIVGRSAAETESSREVFAAQIRSFSPMAIVGVVTLLSLGIVLAWTHLTTLSDLWTTTYGQILSAKVVLTLGVLAAGFVNWRKGIPALGTAAGARAIKRLAAWEVSLASVVLLATALLVHSVKP